MRSITATSFLTRLTPSQGKGPGKEVGITALLNSEFSKPSFKLPQAKRITL